MAKKKKKKKRSSGELHRQIQDSVQALPYVIEQQRKEGKRFRAWVLRYLSGPMLRLMNRVMNASRYRGKEGQKRKQTEQMRRHLQHKQAAMKHVQGQMQELQKKRRTQ
ncbi:MAG TPA: hypothetical protein VMN39_12115 [Longimicrobiaceae bacterium]|nr:hypothetical protein [Longimicrobiaceae bacterium]